MTPRALLVVMAALVVALVTGIVLGRVTADDPVDTSVAGDSDPTSTSGPGPDDSIAPVTEPPTSTTEPATTTSETTTTTEVVATTTTIPPAVLVGPPPGVDRALEIAETLEIGLPTQCPLPLDDTNLLPGAQRAYRGGLHAGIDFLCNRSGETAVAARDGKVVMAHDGFVDPTNAARDAILADARARGTTPPWTLAMLYGRFVVVDHGQVPGVGHVATVYAHFETIADGIQEGAVVARGQALGEVGNSGTSSGSRGSAEGIHLHWELYIDDVYLGAGLPASDVVRVYSNLFDV